MAGFGSFPGAPINPSQQLVEQFDPCEAGLAVAVRCLVLPVEWDRSWAVLEGEIRRTGPRGVLLVGLHGEAERFRLELLGLNERWTDRPDAAGRMAATARIDSGPPSSRAELPLERIEAELAAAEIEAERSTDAGRYLCNETLFKLCSAAGALGLRHYGFVHTPQTAEVAAALPEGFAGRTVAQRDLTRLVAIVLRAMAAAGEPPGATA